MVINRGNAINAAGSAEACFAAMQRHHARMADPAPTALSGGKQPPGAPPPAGSDDDEAGPGDLIYGARAIALYLFNDDSDRARRRVFHLWDHYRQRKEKAGFFKLKGAVCLSKSQWRRFHGLD